MKVCFPLEGVSQDHHVFFTEKFAREVKTGRLSLCVKAVR